MEFVERVADELKHVDAHGDEVSNQSPWGAIRATFAIAPVERPFVGGKAQGSASLS